MDKIIIIGAGPTGLGAAYQLKQRGQKNFAIYERNSYAGGLCASFKDKENFTWDLGGHVIFSRYKYFNRLLVDVMGDSLQEHKRDTWIRILDRWIPYPFQNNIRHLPLAIRLECLRGFKERRQGNTKSVNFQEWIVGTMGEGIAKYFMLPYNSKIWAYPLHLLRAEWISGRVSGVEGNLRVNSLARFRDKKPWGDNAIFRYPLQGGIGEIFKRIADLSYEKIKYNTEVVRVDPRHKIIYLSNGQEDKYSVLINTSPLDKFLGSIQWPGKNLADISLRLKHNGVLVVGLGIHRPCPSNKSWVYFPEDKFPFHRVTYLSNYSPGNVPDNNQYFSLLCETAYSEYKKVSKSNIVEMTIQGLIKSGILQKNSKRFIVSKFLFDMDYAYPLPTLETENALAKINPLLEKMSIYSRGRFGSWRYRVGNLDHCIMQGKNLVDRLLTKSKKLPKACG